MQKAVTDILEGAYADAPLPAREYAKVAEEVAEYGALSPQALEKTVKQLERQMFKHAENLEFEEAARLRDEIRRIEERNLGMPELKPASNQ